MSKKEPKDPRRYEYAPEDFDVICEVCGAKWDFVEDRAVCPNCGDTLNKVEIATLKEEAYIRRRRKELIMQKEKAEKKKKAEKKYVFLKFLSFIIVLGIICFCFYTFAPQQANDFIQFLKDIFK